MRLSVSRRFPAFIAALLISACCFAQEIVVTPRNATGIYGIGEKIEWQLELRGPGTGGVKELNYMLKKGGHTPMGQGRIELAGGKGTLATSLDEPNAVLAEITATAAENKAVKAHAGAVVAPEKIRPSADRPADFDAFWAAKIGQLQAVPMNAVIEPAESGKNGVEYFKVRMDNIAGSRIYGQLARPAREGKFPAMLMVQWAGVYGLPKYNVVSKAEAGWLALNIMAHDLPFDQPEEF